METSFFKMAIITIGSILSSILGALYVPVLLMVLCNVIDYITGLMAAKYRDDGISSYKSIKGIFKKVAMWLLVVVGVVIDNILLYASSTFGFEWSLEFLVGAVVAIWIICNELISILENMVDLGIKIPSFLMPLVKQIRKATESTIEVEDDEKEVEANED